MSSTEAKTKTKTEEIAAEIKENLIPIYIMGRKHMVPDQLSIMKAMEYAGYKFIRGCGCRDGKCGACSTVYRKPGDYHIRVGLACQTAVEPNMYLTQIPFYPANRATYKWEELKPSPEEIFKLYPEIFRCVACNACTKACPMDIPVMDVISNLKQGNIAKAATLSFECIQCGLCVSRCMAEIPQYHVAQLARRIYAGKMLPRAEHLEAAVRAVKEGKFDSILAEMKGMKEEDFIKAYTQREIESEMSDEYWRPGDKRFLIEVED